MNSKALLLAILLLMVTAGCTDEKKLDAALALGANTTSSIFIKECSRKYKDMTDSTYDAEKLISEGLEKSEGYFRSINEEKWIGEALKIGNKSLKAALPTMTRQKCEQFIAGIIRDGGVQKGKRFKDYYSL